MGDPLKLKSEVIPRIFHVKPNINHSILNLNNSRRKRLGYELLKDKENDASDISSHSKKVMKVTGAVNIGPCYNIVLSNLPVSVSNQICLYLDV